MNTFRYIAPTALPEVYGYLGSGSKTLFLAGGTDVIVQLREGRIACDELIDLKHIPELTAHGFGADGTLEVGAAVPLADLYEDPEIRRRLPALVDATTVIGSVQVQSRASLGGNLCNASPAADSTPALIALGATLVIGSQDGTRTMPVEQFCTGPGRNALKTNEILLQIRIPPQPPRSGAYYHRFIPRNEMDIAVASSGARLALSPGGERIESARIALGAVGPTAILATVAAESLAGQAPSPDAFTRAGELAARSAVPISDMRGSVAQRKQLAAVLTVRALQGALGRTMENR